MIFPRANGLVADIAGFSVPVKQQGQKLSFDLPDGKGSFRGERSGDQIDGQWIQSVTVDSGARYATPLVLLADGDGRWTGKVVPREDHMTYYLPVTRGAGVPYSTYLRNPERNQGLFLGVSRIEQDGDVVGCSERGAVRRRRASLRPAVREPDTGTLSLPLFGGTFDFARETDGKQPFLRARQSARALPLLSAGAARRRMAGIDAGKGRHRPGDDREVRPEADRHAAGKCQHLASSQLADRAARQAGARGIFPRVRSRYAARHAVRLEELDQCADRRGDAGGRPIRLDSPVYQTMLGSVPADLDPRKKAMTLEHLISMTAGFDCDDSGERPGDEDPMQEQTAEPDWYRYSLNVPMAWNSGEKIVYCSMKPNLAAGMLEKIAGEPLPEMFYRLVAKPMHMGKYHLFLQPTGQPYGGGGHHFTTRDFMKLTQLFLNDGQWEGRQIVSREWAQTSGAALRVLSPRSGQTYGYLWNSFEYPYRGRKLHAYFPGGNGGQVYIGIPDLDLLIAFTGGNYADPVLFRSQREFVPDDILPAVSP